MTDSPPTTPEEDLELLRAAAVAAGIIAAGFFRHAVKTWEKENASPVTEADIIVDRQLRSMLLGARPGYGWLSEETADDLSRLHRRRAFIVDPIDGTRGFIRGEDSWTISLAVVEDGIPIVGVVYAPARDELYEAARGSGARLNSHPIVRRRLAGLPPLIPAPGAVHGELQAAGLDYVRGPYFSSLAYRLVQVAIGELAAVPVRRGASDWDIAGAAAILAECGIGFEDVCMGALRFNRQETRHGALAAVGEDSLKPVLQQALIRVYGCPPEEAVATSDLESRTT
ncbi:MAG: 3'(2'),5'-bisphosphate nucleotidase CysQ [Devosia sp.]|nr:3'(2'),5'-bisphosphate nucleotidase CysQ [Devosia sp.]